MRLSMQRSPVLVTFDCGPDAVTINISPDAGGNTTIDGGGLMTVSGGRHAGIRCRSKG